MKVFYPSPYGQSTLAEAKRRLTIYDLWRHFGFDGEPKASCHSPFRDDAKPSFSVNADGTLWNDFATGEAGDAVDFFQRASGLSQKDACRKYIELAGGRVTTARPEARPRWSEAKPKPSFPDFHKGAAADFKQLASLRNIGCDGLEFASERGLLWFATPKDRQAWIVTDSARVSAQARRLDGLPWEHLEGSPKAYTLPGSWAKWPIGIMEAQAFPRVALSEGGPDLLAACHFIASEAREADCAPVAMLGASQSIHPDALPAFAGKRVRIFGHEDEAGRAAVANWARQLASVGADVDAFHFGGLRKVDGSPAKDLNDCTSIHTDDFEADRDMWGMMP
jgi:hypothetical protein